MKALSLTQPWATLIAIGAKRIETRSWQTHYRGPVAIHASATMNADARETAYRQPEFRAALEAHGIRPPTWVWRGRAKSLDSGDLPLGAIVATATLKECLPIHLECEEGQLRRIQVFERGLWLSDPETGDGDEDTEDVSTELPFGDYSAGRWGWLLADVVALPEPIPAKGARGLWEWSGAVA